MKRGIGHAAMRLACLFVACAAVRAAAYQLVEVGDGETVTIGVDVDNSGNSELRASAGATIVLPASANAAVNVATRIILVGNGTVTLAAPGDDYVPTAVHVIWGITAQLLYHCLGVILREEEPVSGDTSRGELQA